jgi:hypothetical protein
VRPPQPHLATPFELWTYVQPCLELFELDKAGHSMKDAIEPPLNEKETSADLESGLAPTLPSSLTAEEQELADKEQEKKALVPFLGLLLCLFLAALDQTSESAGGSCRTSCIKRWAELTLPFLVATVTCSHRDRPPIHSG